MWEWHVWDHLVQDYDTTKINYGIVEDHPELININFTSGNPSNADWLHINAIDYHPGFDQIIISVHNFSEIWIIDPSTTTTEAFSHSGGISGRGGDLLYRWGNPSTYNRGTPANQIFYAQHDAQWITEGNDSGQIMVFNNGLSRPAGDYSSIDVFSPPVNNSGIYTAPGTQAWGPSSLYWTYTAPTPSDFYSQSISSTERLPNGHTLICEGQTGHFFEVDSSGTKYWDYVNPVSINGPVSQETQVGLPVPNGNPVAVFRCKRYSPSYSGLSGLDLTPGEPFELNPYNYNCEIFSSINPNIEIEDHFLLYPNPTSGLTTLFLDGYTTNTDIYNLSGELIQSFNTKGKLKVTWQAEFPGVYFIVITTDKSI